MTEQLTFSYLLLPFTYFDYHQTPSPSATTRLISVIYEPISVIYVHLFWCLDFIYK